MIIYDGSKRQSPMKRSNLRISYFYLYWLRINKNLIPDGVNYQDAESCRQATNELINRHYPNKEKQTYLLTEMDAACDENILPLESFDWLKQDERATFWLWAYLCKAEDYELGIDPPANAELGSNWYQRINLSLSPASHLERINIIISFFDNIIITTPPVNHLKRQVMDKLKDQWKVIYNRPAPLKWLPDEEEAVRWAWNSLKSLQEERNAPIIGLSFNLSTPGMSTWFTALSHSERNLALRTALDSWSDAPDTKRLFLLNLNKAWNQQKLRQSRTDKKALNTYLKNETQMHLDFMADRSGLRISDMLEKLINEHYRKTFDAE